MISKNLDASPHFRMFISWHACATRSQRYSAVVSIALSILNFVIESMHWMDRNLRFSCTTIVFVVSLTCRPSWNTGAIRGCENPTSKGETRTKDILEWYQQFAANTHPINVPFGRSYPVWRVFWPWTNKPHGRVLISHVLITKISGIPLSETELDNSKMMICTNFLTAGMLY